MTDLTARRISQTEAPRNWRSLLRYCFSWAARCGVPAARRAPSSSSARWVISPAPAAIRAIVAHDAGRQDSRARNPEDPMRLAATAPTALGSQSRALQVSALVLLVAAIAVTAAASPTLAKRSLG